jgi:hypothetical protein
MLITIMGGSSIANASLWEEESNGANVVEDTPEEEDMLHPKTTTNDSPIPEDDGNDVQLLMREWKNDEEKEGEKEEGVSIELVNAITNEVLLRKEQQQHRSRNMALIRSFRQKIMRSKTSKNRYHRQWKNRLDRTPEEQRRTISTRSIVNEDEESNLHRLCDDMGIDPQFYHGDQQQQRRHQRRQLRSRRYKIISSESLFASFSSNTDGGWVRYLLSASCLVGFATLMSIAIMEGLAHTHTSLRSPNNSHNGTAAAAAAATAAATAAAVKDDEPKIWWEHASDEKNIIPIGQEGQDWEGGRPNIVLVVSSIPKVDANMGVEDIIQPPPPPPLASSTNPLHSTWYSIEVGGWSGGTHVDALRFCVQNNDQQLCPIKQVCPNGPSQPPLTGTHFTTTTKDVGQQWVPVIDAPNTWILIKTKEGESQSSLCMDYTTSIGGKSSNNYGVGPCGGWMSPNLKRHEA